MKRYPFLQAQRRRVFIYVHRPDWLKFLAWMTWTEKQAAASILLNSFGEIQNLGFQYLPDYSLADIRSAKNFRRYY